MRRLEFGGKAYRSSILRFAVLFSVSHGDLCRVDAQDISRLPTALLNPEMRIDGRREDFSVLSGGQLGPQNMLALTFRQDAQIRLYDQTGRRVATVGNRGSGPGEFRRPQAQGWLADTLWIYDNALARITLVTSSGRIVRTVPMSSLPNLKIAGDANTELRNWLPWGRNLDGTMTGSAQLVHKSPAGRSSGESVVVAVAPSGMAKRLVSLAPDSRWETEFAIATVTAGASDASEVVRVTVSDLKPSGETIAVTRMSSQGDTLFSIRLPFRGVAMPRKYVDSVISKGIGIDRTRAVPAHRIPSAFEPVLSAYVQPVGFTWITMREPENRASVVMINRRGKPVARFDLPERADLMAASNTHVWLREYDADDIQSVVRYRITCAGKRCQ